MVDHDILPVIMVKDLEERSREPPTSEASITDLSSTLEDKYVCYTCGFS